MLSEKIKKLRQENGLSQEELANKLNVVRQTISKWEKGLSLPDSDMLVNIAKVFGTTVSDLLDEKQPENKNSLNKEATKNKPSKTINLILLILSCPIWLPIAIATVAVIFSLYISVCAIIAAFWSVFATFVVGSAASFLFGFHFIFTEYISVGMISFAATFILAGVSIFSFYGLKSATKGVFLLTKNCFYGLKKSFNKQKKGEEQ